MDEKITQLTNYTPAVDVDVVPIVDVNNLITKKITWANIKGTLKTYFDTLYYGSASNPSFGTVTTTGNIELGHASDTTIARVSAGVASIEGVKIPAIAAGTSGNVMTSNGTDWVSSAPTGGGSSLWTAMPGTPVRASNTTFTVTGDVTSYVAKGMIIKWTESSTVRCAMVSIPSTYGAPNTTITIIGDTMVSIDSSSLKYCMLGAEMFTKMFAYAGTVGATGTNVSNTITAMEPYRLIGADLWVGTAGTTNSTTVDINIGGTTAFTTKPTLATTVQSSPTPFTADTNKSLALGDDLTLDVDAIQTTAAVDLYVMVYMIPTRYLSLS